MSRLLLVLGALVAMEPTVALIHRKVMHGPAAWRWHRSHHRLAASGFEANDLLPIMFAAVTIVAMALGSVFAPLEGLLWIGTGVTAYGALYLVVHDLYIHERLGRLPGADLRYLRCVAAAHAVHHRTGRAPYGFLAPWVPADERIRDGVPARSNDRLTSRSPSGPVPDRSSAGSTRCDRPPHHPS